MKKMWRFLLIISVAFSCLAKNSALGQTTYYWIGGSGNWTDQAHWSLTSGGTATVSMPGTTDFVRFDANSGASGFIVSNTIMDTIASLTATNANSSTLDLDLTVTESFSGPTAISTFGSAGKSLQLYESGILAFNFNPENFNFSSVIRLKSSGVLGINLTNDLNSTNDLYLENGRIQFNSHSVNCKRVISIKPTSDVRNFSFSSSPFFISENEWLFSQYSVLNDRPQKVVFQGTMDGIFKDSVNITSTPYDTLIVPSISKITILNKIGIGYINILADTLVLGANEGLGFEKLVTPGLNCTRLFYIQSTSASVNAPLRYLGPGTTVTFNLYQFRRIAAQNTPAITYAGINSLQLNSTGFSFGGVPNKFYWIGNGGNWSDNNHWSQTSGGIPTCFFPQSLDSLIFDVNSFTLPNQTVNMDSAIHVGFMDWVGIPAVANTVNFTLKKNLQAYGDISLDPRVYINSLIDPILSEFPSLNFKKSGKLDAAGSIFGVNLIIETPVMDTVRLTSDFFATDSNTIYFQEGNFKTQSYDVRAQALLSYSYASVKKMYLGNSSIQLVRGWDTDTLDYYLKIFPGNSHLEIGRSQDSNYFKSKNQQFYDVTFNFNPKRSATVKGSNSMHHLRITPGSRAKFQAGQTFTLDSLIIDGGCNKFKIDTTYGSIVQYDTLSVDTIGVYTTIYKDTSLVEIYGFVPVIPAQTLRDTTFLINNGIYVDTIITTQLINNNPTVDTLVIFPNTYYLSNRSFTNYTININVINDTIGTIPLYNYGVETDTLTGRQQVDLFSSASGSPFTFAVNRNQKIYGTRLKDIHITGGTTRTAYFSEDSTNNTGWTFSTSPSSVANFNLTGSYCLGDTIDIANTSTAFSGNFNHLISVWDFTESSYLGDSSNYVFQSAGEFPVSLTTYYTNSCSSIKRDTITIKNPSVSLSMSESDTLICANTSVEFSASSGDALLQFQFFRNNISILGPSLVDSIILSNLSTNDTISVIGLRDGCTSFNPPKLVFKVIPLPTLNLASTDSDNQICIGTPVTFTCSGANKYRFFKNSSPISTYTSNPNLTLSNLTNNDTIYVIGRVDSTLCTNKSVPRIFVVNPLPTVVLSAATSSPICAGTSVTFTAGGANLYEYFVNGISQGVPSTTATFTSSTLSNNAIITVRGTSLAGCVKMSNTLNYNVIANPVVSITVDDSDSTICNGNTISFYASGASEYEFFVNGATQGAASPSNSFSTSTLTNGAIVSVKGNFGLCANNSSSIPIIVLNNPTTSLLSSDANDTICQNQSITYTASGASIYQFFVNGIAIGAPSITNTYNNNNFTNGNIISVVGDNAGCTLSAQKVIGVLPKPNVNITSSSINNIICNYQDITFTGSGAANYSLVTDGIQGTNQGTPTFLTNLATGLHTVSILGTAANGCTSASNSTINVTVNAPPVANLISSDADQTICAGSNVTFTASGATTYQFLVNGISQTANSSISTYSNSLLTNGQVISVKGTTNGCADTSNLILFTVNPVPVVSIVSTDSDNIYCQGQTTQFNASGATDYEFFLNSVTQGLPSSVNYFDGSSLSSGSYIVGVQGSSNGCAANSQMNVIVNANPTAALTSSDADNTICASELISFSASGGAQYHFFVNGISQGAASALNTYSTSSLPNAANVNVMVSSAAGCSTTSSTINTIVTALPVITLLSSDVDQTICAGESVTFTGSGASNYEFFVNNISQGSSSAISTLATSNLTNGQTIKVVGTSANCSSTSSNMIFTVNQYPSVSATNTSGTTLCGITPAIVSLSGAGTYQFLINGLPIGAFNANNVFSQNVLNGDVLSFSGNSFGCISTSPTTFTFNVTPTPVLALASSDADLTICLGDPVTFTGTGAMIYNFTVNGLQVQSGASPIFVSNDLENGYIVGAQGYNSTCPSLVESLVFNVNNMPLSLTVNPDYIVCESDAINLVANGADQYQFFANGSSISTLGTQNTLIFPSIQAGDNFTIQGFNTTTGCMQDLGYNITPSVISTVNFTTLGNPTFCNGDSILMISDAIYGNQWTLNGTPIIGATNDTLVAYISGDYGLIKTLGGSSSVWSLGYNGSGGFGDYTNFDSPSAIPATLNQPVESITSGYDFAIGLTTSGTVYSWGENGSGQLGNGTFTTTNYPINLPTLSNISEVASTSSSVVAVNNLGALYVWGNNNFGQLGVGSNAIINFPFMLSSFNNVAEIVGGKDHYIARKTDGTVWSVGRNNNGQLGLGNLVNVSTYTQIPGLTGITKIGSGENHSFAIASNGDLFVWGNNVAGQLGLGDNISRLSPTLSTLKSIKDATGGANHTLLLNQNNEVYVTGGNSFGQLGITSISQTNIPQKLSTGGIVEISAGEFTSLLRTMDLRVLGSGYNAEQQIQPTLGNVGTFTPISDFVGVTKIEAGRRTSHVIFGESGSCNSIDLTVLASTPTIPVITQTPNSLTSTSSAMYQWYRNGSAIPLGNQQVYSLFSTGHYYVVTTDANGCSATSETLIIETAGTDEKDLFSVNVFPNPSTGKYSINFSSYSSEYSMEVVDMTGRIVKEKSTIDKLENNLDLSDHENGSYFLIIYKDNTPTIQKQLIIVR